MNACTRNGATVLSFDSSPNGCVPDSAVNFEITSEATDGGAYWYDANDPRVAQRITLASDAELNHLIKFHANQLASPLGAVDLRGGVGRTETSDAITFERLQWADGYSESNSTVGIGATEHLFDDRLKISTDLAWSTGTSLWRDPMQSSSIEMMSRSGAARWHKVDLQIFNDPDFKWSMSGQISAVDKGFTGTSMAAQPGTIALIGDREKWATNVMAFGVSALASIEHFAGRLLIRVTERAQFDGDGISATFYNKKLERLSLLDPGTPTSRKAVDGVTIEVSPQLLAPQLMDGYGLIPELISVTFERGSIDYPGSAQGAGKVMDLEALAMWKTKLGETTAILSDEREGHSNSDFGFEGEESEIIDISHSVRFGDWRAGAGVSVSIVSDFSAQEPLSDKSVGAHFSVRYAPTNGAQFEASLGRTQDEFALEADDLFEQSEATTLSVSLDLTNYVQRALDRRDTRLALQYRHELHDSQIAVDTEVDGATRNKDALLISFGTPLN